jgi:hypothetical protein
LPSTNFPDESYPDLDLLISTLNKHGVDYVVVGGVAARAHGATRLTHDLDCVVRRSKDNLERVSRALRDLGAHLRVDRMSDAEMAALAIPVDAETLARLELSTWRTRVGDIDVLADIPSADSSRRTYEDLLPGSLRLIADGVTVRVASLDDVIASKEAAGRAKDRDALPELRTLRAKGIE